MSSKKQQAPGWIKVIAVGGLIVAASSIVSPKQRAQAATHTANGLSTARPTLSKHMRDIRFCESSDNYSSVNKQSPSHTGAYQFADSTWAGYRTGYNHAKNAPPALQDQIAIKEHAKNGDQPWLASRPCWSKR